MTMATRGRFTLEFKQEAVHLMESGQTMAAEPAHLSPPHNHAVVDRISSAQRVRNVAWQLPPKQPLTKTATRGRVAVKL